MRPLLVIIAAFNEERVIADVVVSLRERSYDVVVVDDGSADATAERARAAGARVIRHPVNLGQGAALQTGIEYGRRYAYPLMATFDADGQHDPDDLLRMLEAMGAASADFVLGSRFLGATIGMWWPRRLLLRAAVAFSRITTGMALSDAQNGLRLFTANAARRIELQQNRMAHASEFLHQIAASGLKYVECP